MYLQWPLSGAVPGIYIMHDRSAFLQMQQFLWVHSDTRVNLSSQEHLLTSNHMAIVKGALVLQKKMQVLPGVD